MIQSLHEISFLVQEDLGTKIVIDAEKDYGRYCAASFTPETNTIKFNSISFQCLSRDDKTKASIVLHEIGHAIDYIEGYMEERMEEGIALDMFKGEMVAELFAQHLLRSPEDTDNDVKKKTQERLRSLRTRPHLNYPQIFKEEENPYVGLRFNYQELLNQVQNHCEEFKELVEKLQEWAAPFKAQKHSQWFFESA